MFTNLCGISMSPIMCSSGIWSETEEQWWNILSLNHTVVTKTMTLTEHDGNKGKTIHHKDNIMLNSIGLKNRGISFYENCLLLNPQINNSNTHIIKSITGSVDGIVKMLDKLSGIVEINISCPNIGLSYDLPQLEELLKAIKDTPIKFGFKVGYMLADQIRKMCELLNRYPVSFVTCINSMPALILEDNKSVIDPNQGIGGLSGCIKPFGLYSVKMFRDNLHERIDVIGCGGIQTGRDVFEYILAGATAVQVGSHLYPDRYYRLPEIHKQLEIILHEYGYDNVVDARGRYKK